MKDDEIVIGINNLPKNKKSENKKKTIKKKTNNSKARISSSISKNTKFKINKNPKIEKEKPQKFIVKVFSILLLIFIIIVIFLSSSFFNIKEISVLNNQILSAEKIISLSGIEIHTNIFKFNKNKAINKLKENPYIEDVHIHRKSNCKIEINVKERIPSFMLQYGESYVYINNQGYMLEISSEKMNLPIIEGFTTDLNDMKEGNRINNSDLEKMNLIIKIFEIAKSNDLAELITKIDISNPKNYTIILESEEKTVYLGDCSDADLNTKMLYLKSIIEQSHGRKGEIFLNINLNEENVYLRWSTE